MNNKIHTKLSFAFLIGATTCGLVSCGSEKEETSSKGGYDEEMVAGSVLQRRR